MRKGIWGGTWRRYFVPLLRDLEGLVPRVNKFFGHCGGSTRFGRGMHNEEGVVAEVTEGFGQKAEVAVPEKLVWANDEVGVKEDFQGKSAGKKKNPLLGTHSGLLGNG